MGVTITATNSSLNFDMGYGGFFNLRKNIALALDQEFGENYALLNSCHSKEDYDKNDRKSEEIINRKGLDKDHVDVIDFLYMSDGDGKISYRTCRKIYDLIKGMDFGGKCFRYAMIAHNDYEEFKEFLMECYSHRRNMVWR